MVKKRSKPLNKGAAFTTCIHCGCGPCRCKPHMVFGVVLLLLAVLLWFKSLTIEQVVAILLAIIGVKKILGFSRRY